MDRIPDFIEPITAYRLFTGDKHQARLKSPIKRMPLTMKVEIAECRCRCSRTPRAAIIHEVPEFNGTCGFHGFKTRKQAMNYLKALFNKRGPLFLAKVHFSGKIIEHEIGYRAERMEIVWIKEVKKVSTQ